MIADCIAQQNYREKKWGAEKTKNLSQTMLMTDN
jgi:hypothetical protein